MAPRFNTFLIFAIIFIAVTLWAANGGCALNNILNADILMISGRISDTHGKAVKDASICLIIRKGHQKLTQQTVTGEDGKYTLKAPFPAGTLPAATIHLEVRKPSYALSVTKNIHTIKAEAYDNSSSFYIAETDLALKRIISPALWISTAVLLSDLICLHERSI